MATHQNASLSDLRKHLGLNQRQFAERMGRSQSRVATVETALGDIMLSTLRLYVEACGGTMTIVAEVDGAKFELRFPSTTEPLVEPRGDDGCVL